MESQKTLLKWTCLSLTEKQRAVNDMIIFNDSFCKFYQWSIRNSPRQLANTQAFTEAYLCFLASASAKNIFRMFKKNTTPRIKYVFH